MTDTQSRSGIIVPHSVCPVSRQQFAPVHAASHTQDPATEHRPFLLHSVQLDSRRPPEDPRGRMRREHSVPVHSLEHSQTLQCLHHPWPLQGQDASQSSPLYRAAHSEQSAPTKGGTQTQAPSAQEPCVRPPQCASSLHAACELLTSSRQTDRSAMFSLA
eukprot:GHVU01063740.1.p3 GENE.GHVU01063740.1~~GHVU01063740.1.p3  ORF type:complete len:174 (-),score=2.31 GHVU01063740.1:248-727(-)